MESLIGILVDVIHMAGKIDQDMRVARERFAEGREFLDQLVPFRV